MSNQYLKLRRSSIPGKIPSTSSIDFGELALNTVDGKVYMKITSSLGQSVIAVNPSEITGSFYGTASFALNSDYSLRPVSYRGTTLYSTIPLTQNVSPSYSIFLGEQAGQNTTSSVVYAVYLGYNAGYSATNATSSVFIGLSPGYQSDNAHDSIFIGTSAGSRANYASSSVFLGKLAGYQAASASYSVLLGYNVGRNTAINTGIGNNNIIIGNNITLEDNRKDSINIGSIIFATGSSFTTDLYPYSGSSTDGKVGINVVKPQYTLDVSGSGNFTGPVYANITGSLFGTGSWSNNSISSSVALSSSYAATSSYSNIATSSSYSATSSLAISSISSSYATTSSWAYNVVSASNSQTASLALTASYAPNYLPLSGGTITGNLIVQGTASIAYLNTVYESASVIYSSGSNQFGDASNDVQTLYGTVNLPTGSINVLAGAVNAQVFSGSGQYLYNIPASAISGSISGSGGGGGGTISGSGVSGQVTYWNGTTGITGSSNLVWDNATGRLGIGTSSPAGKLDINLGAGSVTNAVYVRNTNSNGYASISMFDDRNSTSFLGQWGLYGSTFAGNAKNMFFYNSSGGNIGFYVGSGANPSSDLKAIIATTGNLLIQNGGTFTDAGYRLDVNGTGTSSGALRVSGSSLFDINSGSFSIASGSNTFVFVSSSGNVGIGTNSPTATTTINRPTSAGAGTIIDLRYGNTTVGAVSQNGYFSISYIDCFNYINTPAIRSRSGGDLILGSPSVNYFRLFTSSSTGNLVLQSGGTFTDDGQRLQVIGSAKITSGLTVSGSGGSAYALTTTNGWVQFGSTTGFTWDDTNSRVGIGTSSPGYALTVTNDISVNSILIGLGNGSITSNLRIGASTLASNTSGSRNIAIGTSALASNTTGGNHVAIGNQALQSIQTAGDNVAIGDSSSTLTTTANNVSIGSSALRNNTSGFNHTAIGASSLRSNTIASHNTAVGASSMYSITTGGNNTAIGVDSGRYAGSGSTVNQTSNNSIYVGYQSRASANGNTNEIVIGYNVVGNGSNSTTIGNASTTLSTIYGNLLLGTTIDSGYRLEVNGSGSASGSLRVVSGSTLLVGAGSTSATNALVVQNSTPDNILRIRNDGRLYIGSNANAPYIGAATDGNPSNAGTNIIFNNFVNNTAANTGAWWFTGNSYIHTTGNPSGIYIDQSFSPSSGTAAFRVFQLSPTINQTGGANGITRGLYVNPTLTAAADWRSIEWSNNAGWGLYGSGSASNYLAGRLSIGTTVTSSALTVYKSGSTVVDVQGSTGQLFSVVDSMTGSLMSVNDISGIPLLSVNSNGAMYMNSATQNSVTGSFTVYSIDSTSGNGAYFDYRVFNPTTSGSRLGTLMAVWYGSNVEYTDTSTNDLIADTSGISLSADITGSLLRVNATVTTGSWNVKIGARVI